MSLSAVKRCFLCNKNTFNLLKTSHKCIQLNCYVQKDGIQASVYYCNFSTPAIKKFKSYSSLQQCLILFLPIIIIPLNPAEKYSWVLSCESSSGETEGTELFYKGELERKAALWTQEKIHPEQRARTMPMHQLRLS